LISLQLKRLFKTTAVYGIGQILNRSINIILLPVFTAYLSPHDYGIYAILTLVSGLLVSVFSLGIGVATSIYYFDSEEDGYRNKTIWMAALLLFFSAVSLLAIGLPLSHLISETSLGSLEYDYLIVLTLISAAIAIVYQPFSLYLQFEEKAKMFVSISLALTLFYGCLAIFFVAFLKREVRGLVEAGLLFQLASFFIYFLALLFSLKPSYDFSIAKKIIKTGAPYVIGGLSFFFIQYVDRYMLELYCGLEVVGIYSVGYNLGMAVMLFVSAFSTAWTPYFNSFSHKQNEARKLFGTILNYYIMGMGFLTLCIFLFAKPIVVFMSSAAYYKAHTIVGIVAVSQITYGCYIIFLPGLYYAKKTGQVNLILLFICILNIILNTIFIPWWGMLGAASATIVSFFTMIVLTHFASRRYLKVNYDWLKIFRYLSLLGLAAATSFIYLEIGLIGQVLKAIIVLIIFLAINYFFINRKDRDYLKGIWHNFAVYKKAT